MRDYENRFQAWLDYPLTDFYRDKRVFPGFTGLAGR